MKKFIFYFCLFFFVFGFLSGCDTQKEPKVDDETLMYRAGEAFLEAFKKGDVDSSFNKMTASAQAKIGGVSNWSKFISMGKEDNTLPSKWTITKKKIFENEVGMKIGIILGTIVTMGKNDLEMYLTKIDDDWKVDRFSIK